MVVGAGLYRSGSLHGWISSETNANPAGLYTVRRTSYTGHSSRLLLGPSVEEEILPTVEARGFDAGYALFKRSVGERLEIRNAGPL